MKIKRISIVYDFLKELGGIERVMFQQANFLKSSYDIKLVFGHINRAKKENIEKSLNLNSDIKILQVGKGKNEIIQLALYFLFPGRMNKINSDLIISHSFMSSRGALAKKKKKNTPYVVFLHHPPHYLYNRDKNYVNNLPRFFAYVFGLVFGNILKRLDLEAVRKADATIANSTYTSKRIKKIYGIEPLIIYPSVADNFKILERSRAEKILKKRGIAGRYLLLHGRIIKDKRPDFAIEAFSKITGEIKDLNLVISGTIEEKNKIVELAKKLGVSKRVKLLGKVSNEELVSLYNLSECFLMTAPKEDFGLTPIEAMACGCPVVAWNDGAGPSETVKEGINGFFAKPYDVDDFASKTIMALKFKWSKREIARSVKKFSEKNNNLILKNLINKLESRNSHSENKK